MTDTHSFKIEKIAQPCWHWSVIGQTVRQHYGIAEQYTQCRLAGIMLGRGDCCEDGGACDQDFRLDLVLQDLGHLDRAVTGRITCEEASKITGRGDLIVFELGPAEKGGPRQSLLLFKSGMDPMSPTTFDTYIGNPQTGKVETAGKAPYDKLPGGKYYITKRGR